MTDKGCRIKRKTSHVAYYDNYWRCEVKECGKCKVVRPTTEFYANKTKTSGYHATCKVCWKEERDSLSSVELEKRRERNREWQRNNKDKVAEIQRRYCAKNRERNAERRKIVRMKWEETIGGTYPTVNYTTVSGCMRRFAQSIRRKYSFQCKPSDCMKEFATRNDFRYVFRNWGKSKYCRSEAPVVVLRADTEKAVSLADFRIIPCGKLRSSNFREAWRRGAYDTRAYKDSRIRTSGAVGKSRRGQGGGVCGNQTAASVA